MSQFLQGVADALGGASTFDAPLWGEALRQGAEKAYDSVSDPTEGTILTVMKVMAQTAVSDAKTQTDLRTLFEHVLRSGQDALAHTPKQLPILAQAGVVDSGGQGLIYIFQGMTAALRGEVDAAATVAESITPTQPAQVRAVPKGGVLEHPYDVQFLLRGRDLDVERVRRAMEQMGSSTVVAGSKSQIKVHVHVANPGEPLTYAAALGSLFDVVVENMQLQMEAIVGASTSDALVDGVAIGPNQIAVIAVASGVGFAALFKSLRAAQIVMGGQSHNPSVESLLAAVEAVPTEKIVLLPNNRNVVLAAKQVKTLSSKAVHIVPTQTMAQGVSAMLGLVTLEDDVAKTAARMASAAAAVTTAELTRSTKDATLDDVSVRKGEVLGLVDGRLVSAGASVSAVLLQTVAAMMPEDREIIALYYGDAVTLADAEAVRAEIEAHYPHLEVELHHGGQAHYAYILGAE